MRDRTRYWTLVLLCVIGALPILNALACGTESEPRASGPSPTVVSDGGSGEVAAPTQHGATPVLGGTETQPRPSGPSPTVVSDASSWEAAAPTRQRMFSGVGLFFPPDGATGVPTGTVVKFGITRPQSVMLLHLEPAAALSYMGDETPDKPSQLRVYKPQTDLASGTTYTATVEWGYTDPGPDNENRRTASWSFTTAP